MTINTIAYARDQKGDLAVFKINEAISYEGAIEAVKIDLGVERALCLVLNQPVAASQPTDQLEAA